MTATSPPQNKFSDMLRLMRPWQWVKNIFVFSGVIFGGMWHDPILIAKVIIAALAFSYASSAIYIFNDIADCENDKHHPKKRERPLAAGKVSVRMGYLLASGLALSAIALSFFVSLNVVLIILVYTAINILYSLWLKHIVIMDVFCIAAGFMLRILAGTIGVGIPPSKWLLLCGLMITLFLGFTKRRAELIALKDQKEEHRKVLENYSPILLDEIIGICATGVILSYSLYTMSPETIAIHHTENLLYTVPFVIYALFRYIFILHHTNGAGDPSLDLFKDKHIVGAVIGWVIFTFYLLIPRFG